MSERNAEIETEFGDGVHLFRLGVGQLEELQDKCDAGPGFVLGRLMSPRMEWLVEDVRQPIRLGLIGGGMSSRDALKLTQRYVDERCAWAENAKLACAILALAVFGPAEEETDKTTEKTPRGSTTTPTRSRAENGDSATSTATAQS